MKYEILNLGIGDLIIDLDADIEKSSSSNLDSSLVIPLQSAANSNTPDRGVPVDKNQANELSDSTDSKTSIKGWFKS